MIIGTPVGKASAPCQAGTARCLVAPGPGLIGRIGRIVLTGLLGFTGFTGLTGLGGARALWAAPGDWTTFIDGTVYHRSPGLEGTPDRVKHDPIASDQGDLIWAGSSGGLTGHDVVTGAVTRLFRNDGLPSQDVAALAVDADGNLWIGSRAHGLTARRPDGVFFRRPLDRFDIGSDSVRVVVSLGAELWVGTAAGAARVRYPDDPTLPGDGSVLQVVNIASFLGQSPYINAIAARGDTTWLGTQRGVVRLTPDGDRGLVNAGLDEDALAIQALVFFGDRLWAAAAPSSARSSATGGVYRLEGAAWVRRDSMVDLTVEPRALTVSQGDLRLGMRSSATPVYRLDAARLEWLPTHSGIEGRIIAGLAEQDGRLYAATDRGVYAEGDDGWARLPSTDPPSATFLTGDFDYVDVEAVPGGVFALTRRFLTRLDGSGWKGVLRGAMGTESQSLSRVLVDDADRLFLGHCCCGTGTTCRVDRLEVLLSDAAVPIPTYDILAMTTGPAGRVWFGSVKTEESDGEGIYRYDPETGELIRYTPSGIEGSVAVPGLNSTSISSLAFDRRGRLWIGHQFEGVNVWTEPGNPTARMVDIRQFPDGLPSDQVSSLTTAGEGAWVGTNAGLAQVGAGLLVSRVVGGTTLPAAAVTDVAADGCGRVWVATGAGIAQLSGGGGLLALFDDTTDPGPADERVNAVSVDAGEATVWFATRFGLSRLEYDPGCRGSSADGVPGSACRSLCPYPNPLRTDRGQLEVFLTGAPAVVDVTVFDATGHEIWSGRRAGDGPIWHVDRDGGPVPSGVYQISIGAGGETELRPCAVIR